jgi:hypothetical protein
MSCPSGSSRFHGPRLHLSRARIWASLVAASAKSRAIPAAASVKRRGWRTVGFSGHLTMTTAGVSSASTSSIVSVSTAVMASG